MKKKIETNMTINVKIGDYEFNLTKEEAEELYNSLKASLGKNDTVKWTSPFKDDRLEELKNKWKCPVDPPYPYYPPSNPTPNKPYWVPDITCEKSPTSPQIL